MPHAAKIILDSITRQGHRLTTFELKFPRIILAEWNTHCAFGRNSASSRAIPSKKMIEMVMTDPYIPTVWPKNQKGMSASEYFTGDETIECESDWLHARDNAVYTATRYMERGVHKQTANRLLEPFMWHTIINSATEYSNFFNLRNNEGAHPEIRTAAAMMQELYRTNEPKLLEANQWHTPYAQENENLGSQLRQITVGRCARVSYLTHDGQHDPASDIALHDRLLASGHMSPFEHAARAMTFDEYEFLFSQPKLVWNEIMQRWDTELDANGNKIRTHFCAKYQGWVQYRKQIPHEEDYLGYLKERDQMQ